MNTGVYVFSQIVKVLPKRKFERMVEQINDKNRNRHLTYWNHLLIMMFGQLDGCSSLRELVDILAAHSKKCYHLGFGSTPASLMTLSRANLTRDYHIFEQYAYEMVKLAQGKRIDKEFDLYGQFYAFDSTTIDLCMSIFNWARFRSTKSGIKVHTQLDVATEIPVSFNITEAAVHDVNAMDWIEYEPLACYIFDRGYWDLKRLFKIEQINSFFVIREKSKPKYEIVSGKDFDDGADNVMLDQNVRFTGRHNSTNYPTEIRRIVYFAPELHRTFTYYTNNFYLKAKEIAFLYKCRWRVELFFKFMKGHLRFKKFWGYSENSVRIQIYTAIITYCAVAILEETLKLNRSVYEVLRILGSSLLTTDSIKDLFEYEILRETMSRNQPCLELEIPFEEY